MSNPIYQLLNRGAMQSNELSRMIQQFVTFKNNFKGNPREEIENLLRSGRITQQQLNQAQQMAGEMQQMLKNMK